MKKTVYIVHAVDVEGPMTETIEATFERMKSYGLPSYINPSKENLEAIQNGSCEFKLDNTLSETLSKVFNNHSLGYLENWSKIDSMIHEITSTKFRKEFCSKDGSPYIFSWFIYDHHEGFSNNPRYHEVGTHRIFDHYNQIFKKQNDYSDGIYFHYHHPSINGNALESNTCWTNRTVHEEIIARRIIDREWYFSCFRAGLHIERNDMSHWLEMFIPFDFSARYCKNQNSYSPGSDMDWRNCSDLWGGWHPDWYDYRKEGTMKRYLFRCTDLWTYLNVLSEDEIEEAFSQADNNGSSVLVYYNHDYRNMVSEIESGYKNIINIAERYPDIDWKFVNALEAAQKYLGLEPKKPSIEYKIEKDILIVKCKGEIFGPQPYLAIKENGKYFRDNFTDEGNNTWAYRFRNLDDIQAVGIAANSPSGMYDLKRFEIK